MKTKYKWIEFEKMSDEPEAWECRNHKSDDLLGVVEYYNSWRQFVFNPYLESLIFNFGCLEAIADFLKQLNKTKGCYKVK
jgi:hypothetical protein